MALTLVATVGATNANSYATVAEGTTYHEGHLYADDWTGASTTTKTAALVMATRVLDEQYAWEAYPVDPDQALQWPRSGVMDFLDLSTILDTALPQKLKDATCELARQLIASDRTADNQVDAQGVTSLSVGSISLAFRNSGIESRPIPDAVRRMIPTWWGRLRGYGQWREVGRS
jgi:hypothetical protein